MSPTEEQALQFAVMLQAGLPASEAIRYFAETDDPSDLAKLLASWTRSRAVKVALSRLQKKPWQDMTLEERIDCALNQHYNSLAYLLYSTNYIEVGQPDKAKLDTARQALEAKKAGTAGKGDALSEFFADLKAGKLSIKTAAVSDWPTKLS